MIIGYVIPVVLGFVISFVATALRGLLNMTAAKVSLKEGRKSAKIFAIGAATVVFVQAYVAVTFARLISRSPELIAELQEVGVGIFAILTVYFFFFAKKKEKKAVIEVILPKDRDFTVKMMVSETGIARRYIRRAIKAKLASKEIVEIGKLRSESGKGQPAVVYRYA